jgi:hypothetical protein
MAKRYYAKNSYEYWKPDPAYREQKLALLSDGTLVVLTDMVKLGWKITALPQGYKYTEAAPQQVVEETIEKINCPSCSGTGEVMQIVDHDSDGAVYEPCQCSRCNGTGKVIKK